MTQIVPIKESLHLLAGRFDKRITLSTQVGCGRGAPFAPENKHSFKTLWLIVNQVASPNWLFLVSIHPSIQYPTTITQFK